MGIKPLVSIPSRLSISPLGDAPHFVKDLLFYPHKLYQQLGSIYRMKIPFYNPIFIFQPDAIKHVLEKNHQNYLKSLDYETLKITLGKGLLTNEGEPWKEKRKLIQPYFYENVITQFLTIMKADSEQLVAEWKQCPERVLNKDMKLITLKIATKAFFGAEIDQFKLNIYQTVDQLNALGIKKMRFPFNLIPYNLPFPLHLKLKQFIKRIDDEIYNLMAKENPNQTYNLLNLLLSQERFSKTEIRDEIITFLTAGYETTANSLMYTFALLANNKAIQNNLQNEIKAQRLDTENYKRWKTQFPLLTAVINESLRLYPPAWMIGRRAIDNDSLLNYHVEKNSNVIIDLFVYHRLETFWKDPHAFKPERFLDNTATKDYFFPFGGGPRVCIGQHFAYLEMMTIIHHVLSHFSLEPLQTEIELNPLVTLTPKKPLVLKALS